MKVPHGLEQSTDRYHDQRARLDAAPDRQEGRLTANRLVMLGTLDHDVKDIEIVRYVAPVVIVKATTSDGRPVKDVVFAGEYLEEKQDPASDSVSRTALRRTSTSSGRTTAGSARHQLTPDREVKITAHAEGFNRRAGRSSFPRGRPRR